MGVGGFHALKKAAARRRPQHQRRRRGRLRAQPRQSADEALGFIMKAIEAAGYKPGEDIMLGARLRLDRVLQGRQVRAGRRGQDARCRRHGRLLRRRSCAKYPIVSIEDGMAEDDWDGWKLLTEKLGSKVQLVGDDLFVTNPKRLRQGIEDGHRQLHPGQGQPDRHADRDAGSGRDGAARRLHGGDEPPLRRDRGLPPSPTSPSPPTAARSRPARCRARDRLAKYNQLCASRRARPGGALRRAVHPARAEARRTVPPLKRQTVAGWRASGYDLPCQIVPALDFLPAGIPLGSRFHVLWPCVEAPGA